MMCAVTFASIVTGYLYNKRIQRECLSFPIIASRGDFSKTTNSLWLTLSFHLPLHQISLKSAHSFSCESETDKQTSFTFMIFR